MINIIGDFADEKEIVVFGTPYCKYCKKAKKLLEETNCASWTYVNLEEQEPTLEDNLKLATGQKTIPLIYMKQETENTYKFIGGYAELEKLSKIE